MERSLDSLGNGPEKDDDDDDKKSSGSKDTSKKDDKKAEKSSLAQTSEKVSAGKPEPREEPEVEEDVETEADELDEVLTEDEAGLVVHEYLEGRTAEIKQELDGVESDSPEEAEALANAEYINALRERSADDEPINDETLDAAVDEVAAELDLPTPEPEPAIDPVDSEPAETPPEPVEPDEPEAPSIRRFVPFSPTIDSSVAPDTPVPAVKKAEVLEITPITKSRSGDLLLGGIIGYLIGRRRGRKNTEKRLLPIQKQLESEVEKLTSSIEQREAKIRELVRQQTKTNPEIAPALVNKIEGKYEQKRAERAAEKAKKTEGIGKMGLASAEVLPERRKLTDDGKPRKAVEIMTVDELLEIADRVIYDGVNLNEIYKNGRIDAFGLRRVVTEFLRGKNHEKLLAVYVTPELGESMRVNEAFVGMKQSQNLSHETGTTSSGPTEHSHLAAYPELRQKIQQASSAKSIITGILIGLILVGLLLLLFA